MDIDLADPDCAQSAFVWEDWAADGAEVCSVLHYEGGVASQLNSPMRHSSNTSQRRPFNDVTDKFVTEDMLASPDVSSKGPSKSLSGSPSASGATSQAKLVSSLAPGRSSSGLLHSPSRFRPTVPAASTSQHSNYSSPSRPTDSLAGGSVAAISNPLLQLRGQISPTPAQPHASQLNASIAPSPYPSNIENCENTFHVRVPSIIPPGLPLPRAPIAAAMAGTPTREQEGPPVPYVHNATPFPTGVPELPSARANKKVRRTLQL